MKFDYRYERGQCFRRKDGFEKTIAQISRRIGKYDTPHYNLDVYNKYGFNGNELYGEEKIGMIFEPITVLEFNLIRDNFSLFDKPTIDEFVEVINADNIVTKSKEVAVRGIKVIDSKEENMSMLRFYCADEDKQLKTTFSMCNNLSEKAINNSLMPCFGRTKEMETIKYTLCRRTKPNVLLLGKAGCGKTAIVEQLAQNYVDDFVNGKTNRFTMVLELCLNAMVSGTKYRGEFEEKIEKVMNEVKTVKGFDIVLFIDEFHGINTAGDAEGSMSMGQILKPALARGDIKVIGATTNSEYEKYLMDDAALCRRFNNVEVKELTGDIAKGITRDILNDYSKYFEINTQKVEIENIYSENINKLKGSFPDNFINIIDETLAYAKCNDIKEVTNVEFNTTLERYIDKKVSKSKSIGFSKV